MQQGLLDTAPKVPGKVTIVEKTCKSICKKMQNFLPSRNKMKVDRLKNKDGGKGSLFRPQQGQSRLGVNWPASVLLNLFHQAHLSFVCLKNCPVAMYHFGFLIKCSFRDWESFWTFSLPRNSWAGPPPCSGHAGPCQNCHGFFWTLTKLRWTEGDSGQDHVAVAVLWLTPKHSRFEHRSSHALVLMEICLNNIMLLQPFWGLIQSPLRWDNAHWFQWAVNYTFYFRLKSSFFVLPFLYHKD